MKTVEDFKRQAKEKGICKWMIHSCSMCGYKCGYYIDGDTVNYDKGCDCVTYDGWRDSSWEEIVNHYNVQSSEVYIKEMDNYWGFSPHPKKEEEK